MQNLTTAQLAALQAAAIDGEATIHGRTRAKLEELGALDQDGITQEGLEALDERGIV